ncbi:MAG TPA: thioredoxin-disulfide reductase, partial [Candidatus Omnitrophota bacterium]|nr:thioredoxin-disulfide reductase [Candidatus Omnitrophota bacterium]
MFEGFMAAGIAAGGQLTTTTEIENFPGFPQAVSGPELMMRMREQSLRYGTRIETKTVDAVDVSSRPFKIKTGKEIFECEALIIATGATARRMSLKGESEYWQKGISACAVCDGALPMFRNQALAVIGGGDSAVEEATFLTKFASRVYLVHRRDQLRASKSMQKRAFSNPKIEIIWDHVPVEAIGEKFLTGVRVQHVKTNELRTLEVKGLFYAVGHLPNTSFLNGQLLCDETGYIKTIPGTTQTNIKGVFACGDVQDKVYRQAITAAGSGCMAALEAERFLEGE